MSADWHVGQYNTGPEIAGVNQRIHDLIAAVTEMRNYAIRNEIKHMLLLGDIFKTKSPTMFYLSVVSELLYGLRSCGIHLWIMIGNHDDYPSEGQTHALSVFKHMHLPGIHVMDQPEGVEIEGTKVLFFPYARAPQDPKLRAAIAKIGMADVLCLHGTVEGALMSHKAEYEIHDADEIKSEVVNPFKLVLAGHLHQQHNVGHVWYPGSIERLTFDDEGSDKGFLDVTVNGGVIHVKQVALESRAMMTVTQDQLPQVVTGLIDVKDAIVRVVDADWAPEDIRKVLTKAGCYHVAYIRNKANGLQNEQTPQVDAVDVPSFVAAYAKKVGYEGDVTQASHAVVEALNR